VTAPAIAATCLTKLPHECGPSKPKTPLANCGPGAGTGHVRFKNKRCTNVPPFRRREHPRRANGEFRHRFHRHHETGEIAYARSPRRHTTAIAAALIVVCCGFAVFGGWYYYQYQWLPLHPGGLFPPPPSSGQMSFQYQLVGFGKSPWATQLTGSGPVNDVAITFVYGDPASATTSAVLLTDTSVTRVTQIVPAEILVDQSNWATKYPTLAAPSFYIEIANGTTIPAGDMHINTAIYLQGRVYGPVSMTGVNTLNLYECAYHVTATLSNLNNGANLATLAAINPHASTCLNFTTAINVDSMPLDDYVGGAQYWDFSSPLVYQAAPLGPTILVTENVTQINASNTFQFYSTFGGAPLASYAMNSTTFAVVVDPLNQGTTAFYATLNTFLNGADAAQRTVLQATGISKISVVMPTIGGAYLPVLCNPV